MFYVSAIPEKPGRIPKSISCTSLNNYNNFHELPAKNKIPFRSMVGENYVSSSIRTYFTLTHSQQVATLSRLSEIDQQQSMNIE